MRLAHYTLGSTWVAVLFDGEDIAVDAKAALQRTGRKASVAGALSPIRALLELGGSALTELAEAGAQIAREGDEGLLDLGPLRPAAPIPDPMKFICVGVNYRDHADESSMDYPRWPVLFAKFANSLVGPEDPIRLPAISDEVDFEGELGVIIGSRAKDVAVEQALDIVAGYTVINDVSARDLQLRTSQWLAGKALDSFAPCGPGLVTTDEIPDPQALRIETRVNGELLQSASCGEMIFSVAEIISFTSSIMTLEPGDLIATGTPAGVGFGRRPPVYLNGGDVVEVAIDRVGTLRNPVITAASSSTNGKGHR